MATAGLMKNWVLILLLILLPLFSHFSCGTEAYYADFPSANLSVSWKNTPFNEQGSLDFVDGTTLRPILLVYNITKSYPPFGLGFFARNTSTSDSGFYVVVFMMTGVNASDNNSDGEYQFSPRMPPQVLWSANRDIPVGENATLNFTGEGDLVLKDEFGNPVWSTNTSTSYVARMKIDVSGNFMLLNGSNSVAWQSFDNPTDTWLPNQKIYNGRRLTASNSSSDLSTGIYYLSVDKNNKIGMRAFLDSNPPQQYAIFLAENILASLVGPAFGSPNNGVKLATTFAVFNFNFTASPSDYQFIALEPNGHLILYHVDTSYPYTYAVTPRVDLLAAIDSLGDCSYPAVCGHYGVCSGGGQCGCPEDNTGTSNYFWPFKQGVGCAQITPLSCKDGSKYHTFVDLPNVTYFDFVPTLFATTIDDCKEACLNNCSCKAASFQYDTDISSDVSGVLPMATAGLLMNWVLILSLILLPLFSHYSCGTDAYYADFPSANLSVSWKNTRFNEQGSLDFIDGSTLRPILLVYNITKSYPPFGLGFFAQNTSIPDSGFYVVVFMMTGVNVSDANSNGEYQFNPYMPPQVLWSANRDSPVGENATLDFTAEGDLVLRDDFGNLVWSTNTSTSYVVRMEIDGNGNFVLLNGSNGVVWQSFDNPKDTWLPNQKIYDGQRLTASSSPSNLSTGMYYLSVDEEDNKNGMRAFLDSNPPKQYAIFLADYFLTDIVGPPFGSSGNGVTLERTYAVFYFNFTASATDYRFIVLEPNGHLILYHVDTSYPYTFAVTPSVDLLSAIDSLGDCSYPAVCGHYGVCSGGGQCGCPEDNTGTSNYFWPFEQGVGCAQITPLSCKDGSKYHTFVDLPNVTYFDFVPTLLATTIYECKEACLNNCSCKAALFRYDTNVSSGNCSLQSDELYSFMPSAENFGSHASIKVQKVPGKKKHASLLLILVLPLVGVLLVVTFVGGMYYRYRMLKVLLRLLDFLRKLCIKKRSSNDAFDGNVDEKLRRKIAEEAFVSRLFAISSTVKAPYSQWQFAQSPYDADGIQAADQMVVLDLKKRFDESSPEKTQLWAEIQKQKSFIETYEVLE
ncbi:hypothetical protein RHMOL_Rhmol06G0265900 [Rhododendron molle]|uniref:Uncharacterized protein n=1 Tax=Rhododendron molle TaxID=49168 RepID=A0ACC0NGC9_RHOML|nr:hypothetical protein RHMOL_Rhmol06G0265900 [Rhododendron molle]